MLRAYPYFSSLLLAAALGCPLQHRPIRFLKRNTHGIQQEKQPRL